MNRLDKLPDNSLTERVNRILQDAEDIRTTAQRFSSDSVLLYKGFSANAYDMQILNVTYNDKVVDFTFVPSDTTTKALGGVLRLAVLASITPGYGMDSIFETVAPIDGVGHFRLYLSGSDASPVPVCQLKFYIYTNSPGALTATLV